MKDKYYDSNEAKEVLLGFVKDMVEAWEDFLINKETVSALLEEIKDNETTEESYKAIVEEIGFSVEDADSMIAAYQEEVSNGENKKQNCA
jgi:hypothetical protein